MINHFPKDPIFDPEIIIDNEHLAKFVNQY